jgi:glyoxylase-like metal-dependent hydrolase (beta-lactamase superfamily II)
MDVQPLPVRFNYQGREDVLYPVLLKDKNNLVLVDCGYPGLLSLLEATLQRYGHSLRQLTAMIITHHDIDHVGTLYEIKEVHPAMKIYSSSIEAKYINGSEKSLRLKQAEDLFSFLPEENKSSALDFQKMLQTIRHVKVDEVFDGENAPKEFDGIRIIPTPGHTPGHISLYETKSKTLISADALVIENNQVGIANPQFAWDLQMALDSVRKLRDLEIDRLICYHGGILESHIKNHLDELLERYTHLNNQ